MKRDEFENALSKKMNDYRCEPPEGMFAKIETTLSSAGKPVVAVPAKRRLSRGWRYAAAAAVFVGIAWTTLTLTVNDNTDLQTVEIAVSERLNQAVSQPQDDVTATADNGAIIAYDTQTKSASSKTEQSQNGNGKTIAEKIREVMLRESTAALPSESSFDSDNLSGEPFGQIAMNSFSDNTSNIRSAASNHTEELRNQRENNDNVSTADYWRTLIAEDNLKIRNNAHPTMSASLYAGNFGFGSGDTNLKGVKSLVNNGMYASEILSTPVNSVIVNSIQKAPGVQHNENATLRHRMPISAGVRFGYKLNDRLTIETGINYSYLQSTRDQSGIYGNYHKNQNLHYLGIPLGVTYNIYNSRLFKVYLSGGGMIEKGIYGEITEKIDGNKTSEKIDIKGIQPSVDASVGAMFMVSPAIGIYAEPGVAYYFESANQPSSYRTENPTNVTVKFGLKFLFGK